MRNLLVINYKMDSSDQVLSHQQGVVKSLTPYFDKVIVLTGYYDKAVLPDNVTVYSTSWESKQKIRSVFNFYRVLFSVFSHHEISDVFSHMASYRALLASPIVWANRLHHIVWYAHASFTRHLQLLNILGVNFVSSTPESFPQNHKLRVYYLGQGINPVDFPFRRRSCFQHNSFVHIGRFDPSKKVDLIVSSLEIYRESKPKITFHNFGSPSTAANSIAMTEFRRKLATRKFSDWLSFSPAIPRIDIPGTLEKFDIFIHAFQGSLDKVLVEATMTGIPVITLNESYCRIFGTWGQYASSGFTLLEEILAFSKKDSDQIAETLERRRDIAMKEHSENQWILGLVRVISSNGASK